MTPGSHKTRFACTGVGWDTASALRQPGSCIVCPGFSTCCEQVFFAFRLCSLALPCFFQLQGLGH